MAIIIKGKTTLGPSSEAYGIATYRDKTWVGNGGSGTSLTATEPAGVVRGDILIASIYIETTATLTVPSGWSDTFNGVVMVQDNTYPGQAFKHYLFWIRRGSSAPSYNWSWTGSAWCDIAVSAFYNTVYTGDPFGSVNDQAKKESSLNGNFPDVSGTSTLNNELLVWAGANFVYTTETLPVGWTSILNALASDTTLAYKLQESSGDTGTISVTGTGTTSTTAMLISLKPRQSYGVLGINYDLPFADYTWAPTEMVGTYFTSTQNATAYQQNIKAVATNPGTLVKAYLYLQTGVSNGTLITTSSSTLTIGTTPATLNFPILETITNGTSYYLLFQANGSINYYYDNAPSSYYVNIGAPAFGSPPASFAGVFTNLNVLQSSLDYYY